MTYYGLIQLTTTLSRVVRRLGFSRQNSSLSTKQNLEKSNPKKESLSTQNRIISVKNEPANRTYVWGNARTSALGIPSLLIPTQEWKNPVLTQTKPIKLFYPEQESLSIKHVAAGFGFSIFSGRKDGDGSYIIGCGINTDSQLGYHSHEGNPLQYIITPQRITLPVQVQYTGELEVSDIACGRAHTVIATNHGVFSLGNNALGQCGREIIQGESYLASRTINHYANNHIIKVVCGHDHTLYLAEDGSLYSTGLGSDGQSGVGTFNCVQTPTLIQGDLAGVKVIDVSCKGDTVLAVSDAGELFGWGNSEYGQLDTVTNETQLNVPHHIPLTHITGRIKQTASAGSMCAVLNEEGQVFVWGYGILGKGPNILDSVTPQLLPQPLFGLNEYSGHVTVEGISCGLGYFAAVTNAGNLYTWGRNESGVLGLGHRQDQFFPFLVSIGCQPAFQGFKKWVLHTYGDGTKTKTVTRSKYNRIYRILSGKSTGENAKFKFWVKSKGFCLLPSSELRPRQSQINGQMIALPNKKTSVERQFKQVAVVEEFFDIIYDIHVHSGAALNDKHAGQKRTYRMIIELYAFLPREAVTHFLMCCHQCKTRMQLTDDMMSVQSAASISTSPLDELSLINEWRMESSGETILHALQLMRRKTGEDHPNYAPVTMTSTEAQVEKNSNNLSPTTTQSTELPAEDMKSEKEEHVSDMSLQLSAMNSETRKRKLSDEQTPREMSPKKSSDEAEEDDDEDDEEKMSSTGSDVDPERLKAFNMFCRLFVDENLDRMVPISKQPKDKVQAILDACDRQFPEFHERSRKRIRTYLKSCRRMRRAKEISGWDSFRPTPPHLTSAIAESMLALACENETQNAKRMRMGLEPLSASMSPAKATTSHTGHTPGKIAPPITTSVNVSGAQMNNLPATAPGQQQQQRLFTDWRFPAAATAQPFRPDLSPFFTNGMFRPSFPAFHNPLPGAAAMALQASQTANQMALHNNVATDMSVKKAGAAATGKGTALSSNEISTIRQLISGYRESATFLYRSADELEHLIVNNNSSQ